MLGREPGDAEVHDVPQVPELCPEDPEWQVAVPPDPAGRWIVLVRTRVGSHLCIYDPEARAVAEVVPLPVAMGDIARFRPGSSELWYEGLRLVRLDLASRSEPEVLDVGTWRDDRVISFAFTPAGERCAVALFYSGVVLTVDSASFRVVHSTETATMLATIVAIDPSRFAARTWDTDELIFGPLDESGGDLVRVSLEP